MIHIILTILKIIGIMLAVLLLVLLLILFAVLFVPLRYRFDAKKTESCDEGECADGKGMRPKAFGSARWLLGAVKFFGEYDGEELSAYLRILWIKIWLFGGQKENPKPSENKKKNKKFPAEDVQKENESAGEMEETDGMRSGVSLEKRNTPLKRTENEREENGKEENDRQKTGLFDRLRGMAGSLRRIIVRIQNFFGNLADLKDVLHEKWNLFCRYVEFIRSEMTKEVLGLLKGHLFYLLYHIRPRRVEGNLRYGMEDPAVTGQLTGILYLLLPVFGGRVELSPDFEEKVLEGELHVTGHIRICHFIKVAIQVFFSKKMRIYWQRIKRLRRN